MSKKEERWYPTEEDYLRAPSQEESKRVSPNLSPLVEALLGQEETNPFQPPSWPIWDLSPSTPPAKNRKALNRARELFFQGYAYAHIFLETRVPPRVFNNLAFKARRGKKKNWLQLRDELQQKILEEATKEGKTVQQLLRIQGLALVGLEKYIMRLTLRETELSMGEAKLLTGIVKDLHGIKQLELGKATDIVTVEHLKRLPPEELKQMAKATLEGLQVLDGEIVEYTALPAPEDASGDTPTG